MIKTDIDELSSQGDIVVQQGRIRIISDLKPTGNIDEDKKIIPKIIQSSLSVHMKNIYDINRLFNYYYNDTDIKTKKKTQQPSINNKICINYASIAVNTINGYSFSNSLTFSSRRTDNEEAMKSFNDALDDDNYSHKLRKLTLNYGICGLAYKYIIPSTEQDKLQGIYYKTVTDLDPRNTYCVYDNSLKQNKICAISYCDRTVYNNKYEAISNEKVYTVWTKWHQWEFVADKNGYINKPYYDETNGLTYDAYPLMYQEIPIIEYRSLDGTSYFELAIDLINAINALASSRVDDVQQSVDYIITLRDIDTESEGAITRIKECIGEGLLSFKSIAGATVQPEINVLDTKLNQQEVETLQRFLCDKVEEVLNIPNRNSKSSGGDTGSAVESRNGFRSLENKAGIVTDDIICGENESLKVIFAMCKNISRCPFSSMSPRDVEIKDNRNKYENLSNSSTAYSTLRSAGMNDRTALEVTRLVPDAITVSKLNEMAKQEETELALKNEVERTKILSKLQTKNNDSPSQDKKTNSTNNSSNT